VSGNGFWPNVDGTEEEMRRAENERYEKCDVRNLFTDENCLSSSVYHTSTKLSRPKIEAYERAVAYVFWQY
jgi:hypothetical protein